MHWLEAMQRCLRQGLAHVLVTIVSVEGSAPREPGSKMLVSRSTTADSIGGGNLEYQAIAQARAMLLLGERQLLQREYNLGKDLSQCCGGRVTLLFELFPRPRMEIALFGAGHIGQALAQILGQIDCRLNWFDSRRDYLPAESAANTDCHLLDNPCSAVASCAPDCSYLVMTHSHDTDFELVEAIVSRSDIVCCGLIASKSKAAKFRQRLRRKGFSDQELGRLLAPVAVRPGAPAPAHREPMAIAVSIVAWLLEDSAVSHQHRTASPELPVPADDLQQ